MIRERFLHASFTLVASLFLLATPLPGQFLYVANFDGKNVSAYRINDSGGTLTRVPGSPFPAGNNPVAVAVHPMGKFVYVANNRSQNISAYSDRDGRSPHSDSRFTVRHG